MVLLDGLLVTLFGGLGSPGFLLPRPPLDQLGERILPLLLSSAKEVEVAHASEPFKHLRYLLIAESLARGLGHRCGSSAGSGYQCENVNPCEYRGSALVVHHAPLLHRHPVHVHSSSV